MHWAAMPSVLKSNQKSNHTFLPHSIYNSLSLMWRNISRRALSLIFVLFSVTFLTFIVSYFAPGDPVLNMMGGTTLFRDAPQMQVVTASDKTKFQIRRLLV
jgi:hypothetical protein